MANVGARGQQVVGDDAPMTAPPHSLGAHDGGTMLDRQCAQFLQSVVEFLGPGIIGIVAEAEVLPVGVRQDSFRFHNEAKPLKRLAKKLVE